MLILAYNWWTVALRAAIALAAGAIAFFAPRVSVDFLAILFGAYAAVDGLLALTSGVRRRPVHEPRALLVTLGLLSLLFAGVVALWPGAVTPRALLSVVSGLAILRGTVECIAAAALRRQLPDEWFLALAGGISIFFGVVMAVYPVHSIATARWLIGMYLAAYGAVLLGLSYRMRPHRHRRIEPLRIVHSAKGERAA